MLEEITIIKPDDFHVHLRQNDQLQEVLPHTAQQCARALIMPNTLPPIVSAEALVAYREQIRTAVPLGLKFEPLMTFKILPDMEIDVLKQLRAVGAVAGKLYPFGVTTNAQDGVKGIEAIAPLLSEMERLELVLCVHAEEPDAFCLDRERQFLKQIEVIMSRFPELKIVLEHISTADSVDFVQSAASNLAATITAHHLKYTLNDLLGDKLNPHLFCKPLLQRPEDRVALLKAATMSSGKFFLGSDSAPHTISMKESACGMPGVYSAPVLLPVLCEIFEQQNALAKLESFVSINGAQYYQLPRNNETIKLIRQPWTVPSSYGSLVPMLAGHRLQWQIATY